MFVFKNLSLHVFKTGTCKWKKKLTTASSLNAKTGNFYQSLQEKKLHSKLTSTTKQLKLQTKEYSLPWKQ